MGFAVWINNDLAWAQGTHEYQPMGVAVIAVTDLFTDRSFSRRRKAPLRNEANFAGLFASLGEVNGWLVRRRSQTRKKIFRSRRSYAPPYI